MKAFIQKLEIDDDGNIIASIIINQPHKPVRPEMYFLSGEEKKEEYEAYKGALVPYQQKKNEFDNLKLGNIDFNYFPPEVTR